MRCICRTHLRKRCVKLRVEPLPYDIIDMVLLVAFSSRLVWRCALRCITHDAREDAISLHRIH